MNPNPMSQCSVTVHYLERRLGRPSEATLLEIKKRREEQERLAAIPKPVMCGRYLRGTIIKADISDIKSINQFNLLRPQLGPKEQSIMNLVCEVRDKNDDFKYAARPYAIKLGQNMLYRGDYGRVDRCQITDIFTRVNTSGRLKIFVDVLLIDRMYQRFNVPLSRIYEYPPLMIGLIDIEPGAYACSLAIKFTSKQQCSMSVDINRYYDWVIKSALRSSPDRRLSIKILDFQDDVYKVDVLNAQNFSVIEHLKSKFEGKLEDIELSRAKSTHDLKYAHMLTAQRLAQFHPVPLDLKPVNNNTSHRNRNAKNLFLEGIINYFQNLVKQMPPKIAFMARRVLRVRLIHWPSPKSIHVIPDDQDYVDSFKAYSKKLSDAQDNVDRLTPPDMDMIYHVDERCLFRNTRIAGIGKWLRGRVVRVPHINEDCILKHIENCINANMPDFIDKESLLYGIESIDYGFFCSRSSINLRPVVDEQLFLAHGPWSLPCKLFGVEPFEHDIDVVTRKPKFSLVCDQMLNAWVRERLKTRLATNFHIVFRSDLNSLTDLKVLDGFKPEVSLFHRFEPPVTLQDCVSPRRRKFRYDCLNWYLVHRGFASTDADNISEIGLDEWILNMLVANDKL